jgi:uncharacterized protein YbbC (DUF1343 family)
VRTGLERAASSAFRSLQGLRVGVICNQSSVDARLRHLIDLLAGARRVKLARIFGPEHGVRGAAQDMIAVAEGGRDPATGVPVVTLYGSDEASLRPRQEDLSDLDALVFDLQDVGARYYTFIWTLALAMQEAARAKVKVVVLDRPNPLGGLEVEGNLGDDAFRSFVGLYPLPVRHGMTVGEVATLLNVAHGLGCELEIVGMTGWRRRQLFDETGLPWVPPSPNMPTPDTALVYPGLCLLEGTNLSEGRGTTRPFEIFGAPFIAPNAWAERLREERLPGAVFRPLWFQPAFHKFAGQSCGGLMLHVTDRQAFRPFATGLAVVATARELWPRDFRWRTERYEFVEHIPAFDLLCRTDRIRRALEAGQGAASLAPGWRTELKSFAALRRRSLRYD